MFKKKNNQPIINNNDEEPKHKLIEDVTLTQKTINVLKGINHFTNLWNLSLKYCHFHDDQAASELLKPLASFAYLGTLDLSYTDMTFKWLQHYIRPLSIQHLKLYGIPSFSFDDSQCKGFLIYCLPNVWMINDQFISFSERRHWHRYFSPSAAALSATADTHHFINKNNYVNPTNINNGGGGQYSLYVRMHYINPDNSYVPTSEQDDKFEKLGDIESLKKEEYSYFYNNNPINPNEDSVMSKLYDENENDNNKSKSKKLWSNKAKLLLSNMPKTFYMPMEQDKWRIKILTHQFYLQLIEENEGTEMEQFYRNNDILEHVLIHDSNIYYDNKISVKDKTLMYTEYRIILLIILFGSLLPEFPKDVIQKGLEYFFAKENDEIYEPFINNPDAYVNSKLAEEDNNRKNGEHKHYWVEEPTSPLLWSDKLILFFLQLLISRIELESESASSFQNSNETALIDKKTLSIMKLYIYNQSLNNLNNNDYTIYGSYAYVKKTQQIYLAMFNLRLIQLLTFIPKDMVFLKNFQALYNIYAKAILLMIPISYLETSDYNFFMSEEEMINYLRDDKDSIKQQEIEKKKFELEMNIEKKKQKLSDYNNKSQPYVNKYKLKLNNILRKKVGSLLMKSSKFDRLFNTTLDIHSRAVELRYYLNNSIMHVYEAEENYDAINDLVAERELMIKGNKVFFNTVEVSLVEEIKMEETPVVVSEQARPSSATSSTQSVTNAPRSLSKNMSHISNATTDNKMKNHTLRRRHSMKSSGSINRYELAKQRSANISRASLLSAASSSILSNLRNMEEEIPPKKGPLFLKKNISSLLDKSLLDDTKLLNNIYAINETIMNNPKTVKSKEKIEREREREKEKEKEKVKNKIDNEMDKNKDSSETTRINSTKMRREIEKEEERNNIFNFMINDKKDINDNNSNVNISNNKLAEDIKVNKGKVINGSMNHLKNNIGNSNNNKNNNNSTKVMDNKEKTSLKSLLNQSQMKSTEKMTEESNENEKRTEIGTVGYEESKNEENENSRSTNNNEDEGEEKKKDEEKENNEKKRIGMDPDKIKKLLELDEKRYNDENISSIYITKDREIYNNEEDLEIDENAYDNINEDDNDDNDDDDDDDSHSNNEFLNVVQDNYTISQDFSICNTLTNKSKKKKTTILNPNVYPVKTDEESDKEKSEDDELINYILSYTDIAKNRIQNNQIQNQNQHKQKQEQEQEQSTANAANSISYHISRMPITGSARNYIKKKKKKIK
jgi:hypothetical protein